MESRRKYVGYLPLKHEDRSLRFPHRQPRPILDFLIVNRKAIQHRVARIVEPLDDFNKLRADGVKYSHLDVSLFSANSSVAANFVLYDCPALGVQQS